MESVDFLLVVFCVEDFGRLYRVWSFAGHSLGNEMFKSFLLGLAEFFETVFFVVSWSLEGFEVVVGLTLLVGS